VPDVVEQRRPDAAPRVVGVHADLFDVRRPVLGQHLDRDPGHRVRVDGHPDAQLGEGAQRHRVVVGDLGHAEIAEGLTGGPFDRGQQRQFVRPGGADVHPRMISRR
jgi:hypothetical protein